MYLRAQFTGQAFRRLLRFRTISMSRPCPGLYFEGAGILVTRIEFLEVTELFAAPPRDVPYPNNGPQEQTFPKHRLGLKLKFNVAGATLNAAHDPVPMAAQEGFVDVALDLVVQNGKDEVTLKVLGTNFGPILSLAGVGEQEMNDLLGAGSMPLGLLGQLNDLTKAIGGFLTLRHVDLGFDPGADRVELRAELSSSTFPSIGAGPEWARFYANSLDSITGAGDWAFQVDHRLGTDLLTRVMTAAIDTAPGFRRDGGVSVTWDAGLPGYRASVEGEVVDACQCLWGQIDLDVRAWAEAAFSLQANRFRIDIRIDHKVTDLAEAGCCVITTVALFPVLGLALAAGEEIEWHEYLAGLVLYPAPVLLLIAVIAKLRAKFAEGLPVEVCRKDPDDEKHLTCEFELPALSEAASCQGVRLTALADAVTGGSEGLVLVGRIDLPAIVEPAIGLEVLGPFTYQAPRYRCGGGLEERDHFRASIRVFRTAGNYDFRVCAVHVLGVFKKAARAEIEEMTCPYTAWITIRLGVTQYDYTPVKVLITTTHGVLHATIPAPAQRITEDDRTQAALAAQLERVNTCYAKSRRWDLRWVVDPAPYINVVRSRQIWSLVGVAAAETRRLEVVNEGGARLARVDVGTSRAFRLTVVHPGGALAVVQEVEGGSEQLEGGDLHAVQVLAGVEREIEFGTPVLAVDVVRMSPARFVVVHERQALTVFEVTEGGRLLRLRTLPTGDADWVGRRGGTLWAMSRDAGLSRCELGGGAWRQHRRAPDRLSGGCGCDGPKREAGGGLPVGAPVDERQFEHLVHRRARPIADAGRRVRLRHGVRTEETEDLIVTSVMHRCMEQAAEVHLEPESGPAVERLRGGALLAWGARPDTLELLRTLSRREL